MGSNKKNHKHQKKVNKKKANKTKGVGPSIKKSPIKRSPSKKTSDKYKDIVALSNKLPEDFRSVCQAAWKALGIKDPLDTEGKTLFVTCEANETNYTLKVQDTKTKETKQVFDNEVAILDKLDQYSPQLAPRLFDSWTMRGVGYMILEKMNDYTGNMNDAAVQVDSLFTELHKLYVVKADVDSIKLQTKTGRLYLANFSKSTDFERLGPKGVVETFSNKRDLTFDMSRQVEDLWIKNILEGNAITTHLDLINDCFPPAPVEAPEKPKIDEDDGEKPEMEQEGLEIQDADNTV